EGYLQVHPDFSAIFTSNPEEYAGVHKAQDALRNRMITMKLHHYDRETEIAITCVKSGTSRQNAEKIVDIVRNFREIENHLSIPTVRACVMIGKLLPVFGARAIVVNDKNFVQAMLDILDANTSGISTSDTKGGEVKKSILGLIEKHC
ncbi:gas vesicle protein GvpN, partial [Patescibacteria group bacterium]|nr:gas vesicle protein GvpN [Patescibacteria group bacterium]